MMETFKMREVFGSFLADGEVANSFRFSQIEPLLGRGCGVTLDFQGVTNMTDSFANACFANLAMDHPDAFGSSVIFRNCSPVVDAFLAAAISFGRTEAQRLHRVR